MVTGHCWDISEESNGQNVVSRTSFRNETKDRLRFLMKTKAKRRIFPPNCGAVIGACARTGAIKSPAVV